MNRYEKQIKGIDEAKLKHAREVEALYERERKEDRSLTDEERLEVESHIKAVAVLDKEREDAVANIKTIEEAQAISRNLGPAVSSVQVVSEPHDRFAQSLQKSLGEAFTDSDGYQKAVQSYRENGRLGQGFSTGAVSFDMKGTLGEAAGRGGTALVSVPQVVSGVVETLFQKLTLADLVLQGQASTSSIRYVTEGTATNGAAGVIEGGTKPESTLGFTTTDEPIRKIATVLPVAEEMLADAPAIQSYINGRLSLFVKIEEERQLLRGATGGTEVQGLLTSRSVPVYAGGTAVGNKAVQLFKAMNGLRGSAFLEPDWILIHPTDYEAIRLLQDGTGGTQGQFYGGGPFQGQYGNTSEIAASSQVTGPQDTIWGKPAYVTSAVGAGTALIGTRSSAQVWRRGGISVEATNSHSDYFALNLIAIRAEERLGLTVYRPKGFVEARIS